MSAPQRVTDVFVMFPSNKKTQNTIPSVVTKPEKAEKMAEIVI